MNDEELQKLVEQISLEFFGLPFNHQAKFNKRLRTTGGRYLLATSDIEINPKHYEVFGKEELIAIIKHELCHYHLHLQGKGYKHKDRDFQLLLKKVGGARYCKRLNVSEKTTKKYVYECTKCHFQYVRLRRMNIERYVCGKCRGKIRMITC